LQKAFRPPEDGVRILDSDMTTVVFLWSSYPISTILRAWIENGNGNQRNVSLRVSAMAYIMSLSQDNIRFFIYSTSKTQYAIGYLATKGPPNRQISASAPNICFSLSPPLIIYNSSSSMYP
jgi:hypothetical protein